LAHCRASCSVFASAGRLCGHSAAFIGTASARSRALAAVIHIVTFAFFGARITDISAHLAYRRSELTAAAYESGGRATDLGAIEVELDARSE
jgi:hypothetical protein